MLKHMILHTICLSFYGYFTQHLLDIYYIYLF